MKPYVFKPGELVRRQNRYYRAVRKTGNTEECGECAFLPYNRPEGIVYLCGYFDCGKVSFEAVERNTLSSAEKAAAFDLEPAAGETVYVDNTLCKVEPAPITTLLTYFKIEPCKRCLIYKNGCRQKQHPNCSADLREDRTSVIFVPIAAGQYGVGEVFEYRNKYYRAENGTDCTKCVFNGDSGCQRKKMGFPVECAASARHDGVAVVFKKTRKNGVKKT